MDRREELRETAMKQLPHPVLTLAHIEHQLDLQASLTMDILEEILGEVDLKEATKAKVELLKNIMKYSSVDFDDLENPLESYKLPKTAEKKQETRIVQTRYLRRQMLEGLLE